MGKTKVLIADDDAAARRGLRAMLSGASDDISVVDEAVDGEQALIMARVHQPDVILMDVAMPGVDGITATERIVQEMPQCAVVILTIHPQDDYLFAALDAGACSYVLKDASAEWIAHVVRNAAQGGFLDPDMTRRVIREFRRRYERRVRAGKVFSGLTPREKQVAVLVGTGLRNREIAAQLFVTEKTVKNHISGILSKLGLTSRTQLAAEVTKHGLTESDL